jgi:DNA-binding MarR family transcriptional regulator
MTNHLENQDTREANQKKALLAAFVRYNATFLAVAANLAADTDLSLLEMVVIEHLHLDGASTPSTLAAITRLSSGAMTTLLDRLEQRGFVRRVPNPTDRRSVLVEYALQQPKLTNRMYSILEGYQQTFAQFSASQQQTIRQFLEQVAVVHQQVLK